MYEEKEIYFMDGYGAFFTFFAGFYILLCVISLALCVLTLIAHWRIFEKSGTEGWKALIPVYNFFEMSRIATGRYVPAVIYTVLIVPYMILYMAATFMMVVGDGSLAVGAVICFMLSMVALVGIYVAYGYVMFKMGRAFGKSTAFCVCMVLFNNILMLYLGFDSRSQYVGYDGGMMMSSNDDKMYYY